MRWKVPSSKEIRHSFIEFFKERGHSFVHSSPVVPEDDPTLLFANAGMNQFKGIFLGQKEPDVQRAVNSQKCIRAGGKHNDLEEVGKDGYHHTFFEMLGNWSFGDYYKKEAIKWAWELLTEVWKLDKKLLYATVHDSDNEAYQLWQEETDIAHSHISYHGDKDNFWEMGDTGPCGPCSEIHIDRGPKFCNKEGVAGHICAPNGDCDRYIELWNLVFIQYKREEDRSLTPLKNRFVDTGAGLERIAQVLQDKGSNYETDLFMPIIERIAELSGRAYSEEEGVSHRVIADHIRCLCFALADGGFPSNEGRGYVLRRILRRAARHGRLLGLSEPFLYELVDTVIGIMGHHFEELKGKQAYIKMVLKAEEERFNKTLDTGLAIFEELSAKTAGGIISGNDAFMLYDTYGFPLDLTAILAEEKGLRVDYEAFEREMEVQRQRARSASKFEADSYDEEWVGITKPTATIYEGYEKTETQAFVQRYQILADGQVVLQLSNTVFYAESGGQVGDTGKIYNEESELIITDVKKRDDAFLHYGRLIKGEINAKAYTLKIDVERRDDISRNHTATHLLHKALRSALGEHVQQKGSLVHPDYLRFDFTHFQALSKAEWQKIEEEVNRAIRANYPLSIQIRDYLSAKDEGAMALFGEKYSDEVRVVSVSDYSKELCGGVHVSSTGEIGLFKIISEGSIAAGIRRIEAVTGRAALSYVNQLQAELAQVAELLGTPINMIEQKLVNQKQYIYEQEQQVKKLQSELSAITIDSLIAGAKEYDGFKLVVHQLKENGDLKSFSDSLKEKLSDQIALVFSRKGDKISILATVGKGLLSKYHAGKLVSAVAAELGGKGGGKPDSAMAGGNAPEDMKSILDKLPQIIKKL